MIFTFVPSEIPSLQRWFCNLEIRCCRLGASSIPTYGKGEFGVRIWIAGGLAAIDRGMDLEPDVKELTGQEIGSTIVSRVPKKAPQDEENELIWGKDTAKCRTGPESLKGLCFNHRRQGGPNGQTKRQGPKTDHYDGLQSTTDSQRAEKL